MLSNLQIKIKAQSFNWENWIQNKGTSNHRVLLDKYNSSSFEGFDKNDFQRTNLCFPDLTVLFFHQI